jgi:5-methylcytosine-specific restriction protein A
VSMAKRPCLRCGRLTANASRCDVHQAEYMAVRERQRGSAHKRGYTSKYRVVASSVIAEYRARHGEWCPGHGVPAHAASDLTVDHIIPLAHGGTPERANLRVLCRGCNSRKRDAP